MLTQIDIPPEYADVQADELAASVAKRKGELGAALVILGHHYQSDEIIRFADFIGDSLKLSQQAAGQAEARYIVFCGVHFMAESADILSADNQAVCLPNMLAGCSMAEMADDAAVSAAMDELSAMTRAKIVPVSYVNSTAAVKAVTARHGGACCTSSNVRNVFTWALAGRDDGGAGAKKILAVPDEHLARNTAFAMGYPASSCAVYDPDLPDGGLSAEEVERATFILWKGFCYVHQRFTPAHVRGVRELDGQVRVIVHPECPREVVELADEAGSTEQIIRAVADSLHGSKWAIGTEANLVHRLARQCADKHIRVLADVPPVCYQMARIDLPHLAWLLDNLAAGNLVNRVTVPAEVAAEARVALRRMIEIKAAPEPTKQRA
jgi:quinolinate synthase